MAQRRHHYEQAFEAYLRSRRIPYVAVDEAKKALLPMQAAASLNADFGNAAPEPIADTSEGSWAARSGAARHRRTATTSPALTPALSPALKSFDFVLYGEGTNLLAEIKGRRIAPARRSATTKALGATTKASSASPRLECWCTRDDVESLQRWERLFGSGFEGAIVFIYWCDELPPDALFEEVFEHRDRWYAIRTVLVGPYARAMKTRSPKWGTVDLAARAFDQLCMPLAGRSAGGGASRASSVSSGSWSAAEAPPLPAMALLA